MEQQTTKKRILTRPLQSIIIMVTIFGALGGALYWDSIKNIVKIEDSHIDAPIVTYSSTGSGILNAIYVKEGDHVDINSPIADIGSQTLYAKEAGEILHAPMTRGAFYQTGQTVATGVDNSQMRLVSTIEEDKGLSRLHIGQVVNFTVDAFPGKEYTGVITEISPSSNDAGIAFSISDQRPIKDFDVFIAFDGSTAPELKNGMSAKAYVHTN